jgi:hypothetical protein
MELCGRVARWHANSIRVEPPMPRRVTLRVQSPVPLGDVTMVPATLSGQPDAAMARAMAAALPDIEAPTAAESTGNCGARFRWRR